MNEDDIDDFDYQIGANLEGIVVSKPAKDKSAKPESNEYGQDENDENESEVSPLDLFKDDKRRFRRELNKQLYVVSPRYNSVGQKLSKSV